MVAMPQRTAALRSLNDWRTQNLYASVCRSEFLDKKWMLHGCPLNSIGTQG
jgi:hypothetical protein